jgi:5-methylcytosine-specific restriction endonuclease McrA
MTRRNFTPKTKGLIRERSEGVCEVHLVPRCMYPALPEACKRIGTEVDHITPAYVEGPPTVENGAFLCGLCHKVKTVTDNKEAKRSNRLAGKTQADKRAQKKAEGRHKPIAGRGFDKGWTKRMDGTTIKRETKP